MIIPPRSSLKTFPLEATRICIYILLSKYLSITRVSYSRIQVLLGTGAEWFVSRGFLIKRVHCITSRAVTATGRPRCAGIIATIQSPMVCPSCVGCEFSSMLYNLVDVNLAR